VNITIADLCLYIQTFAKIENPSERVKNAKTRVENLLCMYVESLQVPEPPPGMHPAYGNLHE
jgi:hypothetical protein